MKVKEIRDADVVSRPHEGWSTSRSAHGRSTVYTFCPFCKARVEGYAWSIAGHGFKPCECGAIIGWRSDCYQKTGAIK